MYQLTNDPDRVICLDTMADIPRGHYLWDAYERFLAEGNTPAPVPPPYVLHSPQHYQAIRSAAWEWMTAWVRDRRYDTIETCCSYFNSSVPRYRNEARAMVAWRDAVNQELEAMVLAAPAGIETWEQVRALLPQPETFDWPGEVSLPLGTGESAVLE
ncbi:TPA: hypothetical protein ACOFD8_002506 [Stenotrophomonas maltophilia]